MVALLCPLMRTSSKAIALSRLSRTGRVKACHSDDKRTDLRVGLTNVAKAVVNTDYLRPKKIGDNLDLVGFFCFRAARLD